MMISSSFENSGRGFERRRIECPFRNLPVLEMGSGPASGSRPRVGTLRTGVSAIEGQAETAAPGRERRLSVRRFARRPLLLRVDLLDRRGLAARHVAAFAGH